MSTSFQKVFTEKPKNNEGMFLSLCREKYPPAKTRLQCSNSNQGHLCKFCAN